MLKKLTMETPSELEEEFDIRIVSSNSDLTENA